MTQGFGCWPWSQGAGWVQAVSSSSSAPLLVTLLLVVAPCGAPVVSVPGQGRWLHPASSTKPTTQQLAVKVMLG